MRPLCYHVMQGAAHRLRRGRRLFGKQLSASQSVGRSTYWKCLLLGRWTVACALLGACGFPDLLAIASLSSGEGAGNPDNRLVGRAEVLESNSADNFFTASCTGCSASPVCGGPSGRQSTLPMCSATSSRVAARAKAPTGLSPLLGT